MRSIAWLLAALLATGACRDREIDVARQIVLAEEHEASARRELVRLERELAGATAGKAELEQQIAAQREVVRAAEVAARKLRIQRKQ